MTRQGHDVSNECSFSLSIGDQPAPNLSRKGLATLCDQLHTPQLLKTHVMIGSRRLVSVVVFELHYRVQPQVAPCYPRRTFDPMISAFSTSKHWVTIAYLRTCSESYPYSQARFMDCHTQKLPKEVCLTLARPRYYFGGLRPRETPKLWCQNPYFLFFGTYLLEKGGISRAFSFCIEMNRSFRKLLPKSPTYAEFFKKDEYPQYEVKVHGVSSSRAQSLASSRECQVRWRLGRDSRTVITPFMQANNYLARNFATLEPSELWLPFTGPSICLLS